MMFLVWSKTKSREKQSPGVIVLLASLFPQACHLPNHPGCDSSPLVIALHTAQYTHYTLHKYTHYTVPETQCTLYLKQHSRHYTFVKHTEYKTHCALKSEHTKIPTFTQQCWLIVRWQEFKGGWLGTRDQHTDQSSSIHCLNTTHTKHYKVLWLYVAGCDSKRGRECANGTSLECDRSCSTWSVWRQFSLPSTQSMDNSPTPEVAEFNRLDNVLFLICNIIP